MDTNSKQNTLQINTFTGGMNTDTSDMYLKSDLYRYAENVRITSTEDGAVGELRLIEGTEKLQKSGIKCDVILDVNYIKNICTIIHASKNADNSQWLWSISLYDSDLDDIYDIAGPFGVPIWNSSVDLNNLTEKILSTTVIWEADDNIKLYIADGIHLLLMLRIQKTENGYLKINGSFELLFLNESLLLPPVEINVGKQAGSIKNVKVLYCYILYKKYGRSTNLSCLSRWISLYKDDKSGFIAERSTNKSVEIKIPEINDSSADTIQIYRISYDKAGASPTVDIIYDGKYTPGKTIIDYGSNIRSTTASELLSSLQNEIIPKLIEQKNNYLFSANVKYKTDEVNKEFDDYDMRCFSRGDYYYDLDDEKKYFSDYGPWDDNDVLQTFLEKDIDDIHNDLLDNSEWLWDKDSWKPLDGVSENGIGEWLRWSYLYRDPYYRNKKLYEENSLSPSTYLRNEVYRFGIRFFNKDGKPSSVKWIADIKMPRYSVQLETYYGFHDVVNIKFSIQGINKENSPWKLASAFEIVQCIRTNEDTFGLTLGIVSFPMFADEAHKRLCCPYLMSLNTQKSLLYGDEDDPSHDVDHIGLHKGYLLFASPEVVYQQDDIDAIFKNNMSNLYISPIFLYHPLTDYTSEDQEGKVIQILDQNGHDLGLGALLTYPVSSNNRFIFDAIDYGDQKYELWVNGRTSALLAIYRNSNESTYRHGLDIFSGYDRDQYLSASAKFIQRLDTKVTFFTPDGIQIKNAVKIESLDQEAFYNNGVSMAYNSTAVGDGYSFYNWSSPWTVNKAANGVSNDDNNYIKEGDSELFWGGEAAQYWRTPICAGGKYMLITLQNDNIFDELIDDTISPTVTVCQIYKKGILPYRGRTKDAIDQSIYFTAAYKKIPTEDLDLEVMCGDGYIGDFVFNHLKSVFNPAASHITSGRITYVAHLESRIDLKGLGSDFLYNDDDRILDKSGTVNGFVQNTGLYLYNSAYSVIPDMITLYANDEKSKINEYTNRVHYSLPKINNESVDSWSKFQPADFIDVSTKYGLITGLKLFKDKLIFLQDKAAGILSTNDRTIITDSDSNNIILGNSGNLSRYDYITTLYGMKQDQKVYTTSNESLYWWDGYNKEIIQYQDGYNINLLQHQNQINSYIKNKKESDTPEIFYDKLNKEVVFNVVGNEAVVYNEKIGKFTSIYKFCPTYHCDLTNKQTVIKNQPDTDTYYYLYEYNKSDNEKGSLLFDENAMPLLKYIVNDRNTDVKVFDTLLIGGRFYGGSEIQEENNLPYFVVGEHNNSPLRYLRLKYNTPLKQESSASGDIITNREYDYKLDIPRNGNNPLYGNRMRGKTMQCEIKSESNDLDFSLQYVITKYRISWT